MNKYTNDTKWNGVANTLESKINIIKTILIIYKDGLKVIYDFNLTLMQYF